MPASQLPGRVAALPFLLNLTAVVILVDQTAILLASIVPPSPGAVQWRFGAVGLAAGRATPFLLADLLLLAAAFLGNHRGWLRGLAFLHLFLAPLVLAVTAFFILDALEVRQGLPLEARARAVTGAGRAAAALVVGSLFAFWVGIRILRTTPSRPTSRGVERLVVDSRGEAR